MVKALRPGTAIISAECRGRTRDVTLTVRVRTALKGTIVLANSDGQRTLRLMYANLDGRNIGYDATDLAGVQRLTARIGPGIFDPLAGPGAHELTLDVTHEGAAQYIAQPDLRLIDFDTGLELATVPVSSQQVNLDQSNRRVRWLIEIPLFDR